jgi:hypothetical protein
MSRINSIHTWIETQLDPDFILVILNHPVIMANMQLVRNRHNKFLIDIYSQINKFVDKPRFLAGRIL